MCVYVTKVLLIFMSTHFLQMPELIYLIYIIHVCLPEWKESEASKTKL